MTVALSASVLCFGDSNTHGQRPGAPGRFPADVRWPGVLQKELGPGTRVIEEGLSGRTTLVDDPAEPYCNGRDYLIPCLWSHGPLAAVVMGLGTNDLKVHLGLTPRQVAANAEALVQAVLCSGSGLDGAPPLLVLLPPPPIGPLQGPLSEQFYGAGERARELVVLFRTVATDAGCAFLDTHAHSEVGEDGLHLSARGHAALGRAVADTLRRLLQAQLP